MSEITRAKKKTTSKKKKTTTKKKSSLTLNNTEKELIRNYRKCSTPLKMIIRAVIDKAANGFANTPSREISLEDLLNQ